MRTDLRPGDRVRTISPDYHGLHGVIVKNCPDRGGYLVRAKDENGQEQTGGFGYEELEFIPGERPPTAWERIVGPEVDFG